VTIILNVPVLVDAHTQTKCRLLYIWKPVSREWLWCVEQDCYAAYHIRMVGVQGFGAHVVMMSTWEGSPVSDTLLPTASTINQSCYEDSEINEFHQA